MVSNGREAIIAVLKEGPDLIVLDVEIPELDGFETCRMIKSKCNPEKCIPIIFHTKRLTLESLLVAYSLGADDYISKGVSLKKLRVRVRKMLEMVKERKNFVNEIIESRQITKSLQESTDDANAISRFLQESFDCHSFEDLCASFFRATDSLKLDCVLSFDSGEGVILKSNNDSVHSMDQALIEESAKEGKRIITIGNEHVFYHWEKVSLFVKNTIQYSDYIGGLLKAFEANLHKIQKELFLIKNVIQLKTIADRLLKHDSSVFEEILLSLTGAYKGMGMAESELVPLLSIIEQGMADIHKHRTSGINEIEEMQDALVDKVTSNLSEEVPDDVCFF